MERTNHGTLKTAIVGCGKVGHLHAKALGRAPESVFVAACGRDLARTEKFAANYNVKALLRRGGNDCPRRCPSA